MANLKEIAKAKGIEIKDKTHSSPVNHFQKRRTWTEPEEEKSSSHNDGMIRQSIENNIEKISQSFEKDLSTIKDPSANDHPTQRLVVEKPLAKSSSHNDGMIRQSIDINHLVGKEKVLLRYIVSLCKNKGSLETDTVSSDDLKLLLEVDNNGLANIVFRVKDKGFLSITEQKKGRVSWRKFSVTKNIYEQILRKGLENNIPMIRDQYPKSLDKPIENHSYNSSSINLNNSNNYNHIEIPVNVSEIGFGSRHVSQILEMKKLNETELQDSLYHFSEDLKTGLKTKVKTSPLALLIGILRNGSPYISEGYLASLKIDLDRLKTRVLEYETLKKEFKEQALIAKFVEWKEKNPAEVQQVSNEIQASNKLTADNPRFLEMMIFQRWEEKMGSEISS